MYKIIEAYAILDLAAVIVRVLRGVLSLQLPTSETERLYPYLVDSAAAIASFG